MEAWRWREALLLLTAFEFSVGHAIVGMSILLVLVIGELIAGEPLWKPTRLDPGLVGLLGTSVASALLSEWRQLSLVATAIFAGAAFVTVRAVVLATLQRPEFPRRFLIAWAVGGVVASIWAIAGMGADIGERAQIPGLGFNALGTTLAVTLVLLAGLSLEGPRRLLFGMAMPVVAIALVLTWSRGAWLGAALGLTVLAVRTPARRLVPWVMAVLAVMIATAPFLVPRWARHLERLRNVLITEGSTRIAVWRIVPDMVASHPALGTGLGTFQFAYARSALRNTTAEAPSFAHNIFLNFTVETGLLGLAALLLFLGSGAVGLIRWHRRSPPGSPSYTIPAAALAAFVAVIGHQLVDGTLMSPHMAFGLFALVGMGAVMAEP